MMNLTIAESNTDLDDDSVAIALVELSTDEATAVYHQLREYLLYSKWLHNKQNNIGLLRRAEKTTSRCQAIYLIKQADKIRTKEAN